MGKYVCYEDYARLKDEVDNLDSALQEGGELVVKMSDKISSLKAEIQRLTDEVGLMNQLWQKYLTPEIRKAMVNEAKKGGQS